MRSANKVFSVSYATRLKYCVLRFLADNDDSSAGWTVVFQTQIAFTVVGWLQFMLLYPSKGNAVL